MPRLRTGRGRDAERRKLLGVCARANRGLGGGPSGFLLVFLSLCAAGAVQCSSEGTGAGELPESTGTMPTVGEVPKPPLEPAKPTPVPLELEGLDCAAGTALPSEGRLLTRLQYENTVTDLFGGRIVGPWTQDFPSENEVMGFRTNAEFHRATPWLVESQLSAAESIAARVRQEFSALLPCVSDSEAGASLAAECAGELLDRYGARAFRRPMREEERTVFLQLFETTLQSASVAEALELVLQALLQSPQFLYRWETDVGSPTASGAYALGPFEQAARLSYLLWNTMPDEELWQSAATGALLDANELRRQAERMLASPKLAVTVSDFAEQWLGLGSLASAVRRVGVTMHEDGSTSPLVDSSHSAAWERSVQLFLADLYQNGGTFEDLFSSSRVYVDASLWNLYPTATPFTAGAGEFAPVEYPASERWGILTQPGLMALLSHPDQSAPIQRGVFVREGLLCDPPPPPPPSVNPTPPALDPNATTRERFAQHTANAGCSGCHQLIDPIGLGLENYDELGRFREEENGLALDVAGEIVGTAEEGLDGPFVGARELGQRLASSGQAKACFVTQWYRYGMGRIEQQDDLCSVRQVYDAFVASGGDLKAALLGLVMSDAFRYRLPAAAPTTEGGE